MKAFVAICWLMTALSASTAAVLIFFWGVTSMVTVFGLIAVPYVFTRAVEGFARS